MKNNVKARTKLSFRTLLVLLSAFAFAFLFQGSIETVNAAGLVYLDDNGSVKTLDNPYMSVTSEDTTWGESGSETWYVVDSNVTNSNRITVNGDVHLILSNNCTLNATSGITVTNNDFYNLSNRLTIYAQSKGSNMGALSAQGKTECAGIGGFHDSSYRSISGSGITVNGGKITAKGGSYAAGIGGASDGSCYGITINGGEIIANGGNDGAGIGVGWRGYYNDITINGGIVKATGSYREPGIGTDYEQYKPSGETYRDSHILITGGTIIAKGGQQGSTGIGVSGYGENDSIIVTGGNITAISDDERQYGIGFPPTNGTDNVYKTKVDLSDIYGANSAINSAELFGLSYGWRDVYTDDSGCIYLYLPEGTTIAEFGGNSYVGSVTYSESNELKASSGFSNVSSVTINPFDDLGYGYKSIINNHISILSDGAGTLAIKKVSITGDADAFNLRPSGGYSTSDANILDVYYLQPKKDLDAGTYKVDVTVEYYDSKSSTKSVTLNDVSLTVKQDPNNWEEELSCSDLTYGDVPKPSAKAAFGEVKFKYCDTEDGTYTDTVPTAAGNYYVKAVVEDSSNYAGLISNAVSFAISKKSLTDSTVSIAGINAYEHTGEAIEPDLTIVDVNSGYTFKEGVDYSVEYENNIDIGNATIKISGINSCTGELTTDFAIKDHDWEDTATIEVPATCTEEGRQSVHCKNCDAVKDSEVIPATGHKWEETATIEVPATCTEEGKQSVHCKNCDTVKDSEVIPATGHGWGTPTYVWSKDYKTVTATSVCKHDSAHKETETVNTTSKVTKSATYTAKGQTTYTAVFTNDAFGTQTKVVTNIPQIAKKANTLTVKPRTATVKYSKVKKKTQTVKRAKALTVSKPQGTVTYKLTGVTKAKFKKYFKVNAKTGNITVKKKLKKGTYRLRVKVTAAGTTEYKAGSKTVTTTIKVK